MCLAEFFEILNSASDVFTIESGRKQRELYQNESITYVLSDTGSNLSSVNLKTNTKPLNYRGNDE